MTTLLLILGGAVILAGFRLGMYLGELDYRRSIRAENNPRFDAILNERPI
jgi:hypothetical protein